MGQYQDCHLHFAGMFVVYLHRKFQAPIDDCLINYHSQSEGKRTFCGAMLL
jgi:hypothetical protein